MSPDPIRRKGRKTLAKVYDSLSDPEETADRSRIIGLPTKKEARDIRDELTAAVYGQINVYGVTTKSERHKRSYWTRTADGNGIGGRKAPVPYGS